MVFFFANFRHLITILISLAATFRVNWFKNFTDFFLWRKIPFFDNQFGAEMGSNPISIWIMKFSVA